jgi:hypothetical protein
MGVWRSGSASALHAEGLGFDPLVVHTFLRFYFASIQLRPSLFPIRKTTAVLVWLSNHNIDDWKIAAIEYCFDSLESQVVSRLWSTLTRAFSSQTSLSFRCASWRSLAEKRARESVVLGQRLEEICFARLMTTVGRTRWEIARITWTSAAIEVSRLSTCCRHQWFPNMRKLVSLDHGQDRRTL